MSSNQHTGLVVSTHGRHCVVEDLQGNRVICHPRGKKNQVVVGDRVTWQPSKDEGTIEEVQTRRNLFYRQDEIRTKSFAANLDQILILIAAQPEFSEMQLTRALISAQAQGIQAIIALNKHDLTQDFERAWQRLEPYRDMGYKVLPLALKLNDLNELKQRLNQQTTLVLGPSGTGKSTLINCLIPHMNVQTGEISQALNSGKHTTTATHWYWIDRKDGTAIIDSPGFQEFGLYHLQATDLAHFMPDFKTHLGECKFHNCTHLHEPQCQIRQAVEQGKINASRYKLYAMLFEELNQRRNY
jgi:ribosome biogenesis GTPase / thiamine phosphate phosphatase